MLALTQSFSNQFCLLLLFWKEAGLLGVRTCCRIYQSRRLVTSFCLTLKERVIFFIF